MREKFLTIFLGFLLLAILIPSFSLAYVVFKKQLFENTENKLTKSADYLLIRINQNPQEYLRNPKQFLYATATNEFQTSRIMVEFLNTQEQIIAKSPNLINTILPFSLADLQKIQHIEFVDGSHLMLYQAPIFAYGHLYGYLVMGISTSNLNDVLGLARNLLLGIGLVLFILMLFSINALASYNIIRQQRRFLSYASHELRTPLAVIMGHAEVALLEQNSKEDYRQKLMVICETASYMNRLVRNFLSFFYYETGSFKIATKPVRIDETIMRVVAIIKQLYPLKTITFHLEKPLLIDGDEVLIQEVVTNLLDNAAKYTPETTGQIEIKLERHKKWVQVDFIDNGTGIPPKLRYKIFSPYFRIEKKEIMGTGLGLPICKLIIEKHGGSIKIVASRPQNTCIRVLLPASQQERG